MIRRDPHRRRPRFGFTLIELLVVIVIIGILISLLLPVIIAAVRRANEAKASADIQTIALGLAKFKDTYGEFPPSRVVLNEQGFYSVNGGGGTPNQTDYGTPLSSSLITWYATTPPTNFGTSDISFGELADRSLRILRKMFPRATLVPEAVPDPNNPGGTLPYWPDFNGNAGTIVNGTQNNAPDPGFIYLEGHECLVFFLGGIPIPSAGANGTLTYGTSGFGKEPRYPFKNANSVNTVISTANRTQPAYEFRGDRLIDPDGDGIPGYLDTNASGGVGVFYAYFAAYGGAGYDPNDVNFGEEGNLNIGTFYRVGFPTLPGNGNTVGSPAPNPYTTGFPTPVQGAAFNPNQSASYINVNSFQIISAGGDGLFGMGGQFNAGNGDRLPMPPRPTDVPPQYPGPPGPYTLLDGSTIPDLFRQRENDNLTSFTAGRLN